MNQHITNAITRHDLHILRFPGNPADPDDHGSHDFVASQDVGYFLHQRKNPLRGIACRGHAATFRHVGIQSEARVGR